MEEKIEAQAKLAAEQIEYMARYAGRTFAGAYQEMVQRGVPEETAKSAAWQIADSFITRVVEAFTKNKTAMLEILKQTQGSA